MARSRKTSASVTPAAREAKARRAGSAAPREIAGSQRELARMLGVANNAVSQYVRDDQWPFGRSGPYDVAAVRAWVAAQRMPPAGGRAKSEEPKARSEKQKSAGKPPRRKPQNAAAAGTRPTASVPLPNSDRDASAEAEQQAGSDIETQIDQQLAGMSLEKRSRIKVLLGRAKNLDLDAAIKSGRYVLREKVEEGRVARIVVLRTAFEQLPRRIAVDLSGQSVQVIEDTLEREIAAILESFARGTT